MKAESTKHPKKDSLGNFKLDRMVDSLVMAFLACLEEYSSQIDGPGLGQSKT